MLDLLESSPREAIKSVQLGLRLTPHSTIELTSPPWIRSVAERIHYLLALPENWDGENSKPLEFECAMEVLNFLLSMAQHETPAPQLIPTSGQGIQIEWHLGGCDFEIKFEPNSPATYYYVGADDKEHEGEIAQDSHLVASLIRGLPARNERPHTTR